MPTRACNRSGISRRPIAAITASPALAARSAQVVRRQPAPDLPVNIVDAECGRILFEPEAAQPFGNVHRASHTLTLLYSLAGRSDRPKENANCLVRWSAP